MVGAGAEAKFVAEAGEKVGAEARDGEEAGAGADAEAWVEAGAEAWCCSCGDGATMPQRCRK